METFELFVSYGRYDADMFIIGKIEEYLRAHLKTLWIDKEQIEAAEDWREEIFLGIKNSRNVLGLLSKYSTKDRSVCLEELAIAVSYPEKNLIIILLDPENELKMPTTVTRKQWIDLSSWKDHLEDGKNDFAEWFDLQMRSVLEIIESKDNLELRGDITTLRRILAPDLNGTKFRKMIAKKLSGREWAKKCFSSFLETQTPKRFLWISGSPGSGKSHLTAHLAHWNLGVAASYFIEWDRQSENSIKELIRTIAFLLATRIPDYRQALKNVLIQNRWFGELEGLELYNAKKALNDRSAMDLMELLVINPISYTIDGEMDNQIIVIDGLDEAYYNSLNPLLELLANPAMDKLPRWLKIAVSFRREPEIITLFKQMRMEEIDLDSDLSENDIYDFLCEQLSKKGFTADFIREISSRCERSFIFAEKLCEAAEDGLIESDSMLEDIPTNISGLYHLYFSRLFKGKNYDEVQKPLSVIVANRGQITREQLKFVIGWNDREYALFMRGMKSFVFQSDTGNYPSISFFHKSIGDWLTNVDESAQYAVDPPDGDRSILKVCYAAYQAKSYKQYSYDVQKFIYESIYRLGSAEEKGIVNLDFEYLWEMQSISYKNSDFALSQKCFDAITTQYALLPKDKKLDREAWVARAYDTKCEVDLAGEEDVIDALEKIKKDFPNVMVNYPDIYTSIENNIIFQMRRSNIDEAKRRCDELYKFIEEHDFEGKNRSLGQLDYHHGIILYELGRRDKKYYPEALTYLKRATQITDQVHDPRGAKRLEVMAMNQIGMSHCWLGQYEESLRYLNMSLKNRKRLYGTYSRYTSVGYDNLARAKLEMAKNRNVPLDASAYEDARTALRIDESIFGRNSPTIARHLQTLAFICEHNAKQGQPCVNEGLEYAMEALEIFRASKGINPRTITQTEGLVESLKGMKNH